MRIDLACLLLLAVAGCESTSEIVGEATSEATAPPVEIVRPVTVEHASPPAMPDPCECMDGDWRAEPLPLEDGCFKVDEVALSCSGVELWSMGTYYPSTSTRYPHATFAGEHGDGMDVTIESEHTDCDTMIWTVDVTGDGCAVLHGTVTLRRVD